jgi:hypothetical protein
VPNVVPADSTLIACNARPAQCSLERPLQKSGPQGLPVCLAEHEWPLKVSIRFQRVTSDCGKSTIRALPPLGDPAIPFQMVRLT